jgi:uncharacterized Rmd1/YagE family protein
MERMTLAEDLGYNDSYFPVTEDTHQPTFATSNPSEYILSHSPPSPVDMMTSMDVPVGHEADREAEIERVQERLEVRDGLDDALGLRVEEEVGVKAAVVGEFIAEQTGTHMSPNHPGYLEHRPSPALNPGDLVCLPDERDSDVDEGARSSSFAIRNHVPESRPTPPVTTPRARWRKSHSTHNQVAEAVFFSYGVSVFFGFQEGEERMIMEDCEGAGSWIRGQSEDDWEVEEFHYVVSAAKYQMDHRAIATPLG